MLHDHHSDYPLAPETCRFIDASNRVTKIIIWWWFSTEWISWEAL